MQIRNLSGFQLLAFAAAAIVGAAIQPKPARADTPAALAAIADAADRICGIVATQGESGSKRVEGEVHAELSGLARRLATIGGSGAADITSSAYQGLLQNDLPATLKDVRACKMQVLDKLQSTLLPGATKSLGPGAPTPDLIQAPENAPTVESVKTYYDKFGLYSCKSEEANVICYIVMSRVANGHQDYSVEANNRMDYKLVDNFHIAHRLKRASFIDGLGNRQQTTNLSSGESIWLSLEFGPMTHPISSARIIFPPNQGIFQLRGAVN